MELFNQLLQSTPWTVLRTGIHLALFLAALYLLRQFWLRRHELLPRRAPKPKAGFGLAMLLVLIGFAGILIYQASWQLLGATRPDFIAFMQSYDRRQFNPAHWIDRGRLLDHRARVLALTRETGAGAEIQVQRQYPGGPALAHVLGYTHPKYGNTGIEAAANLELNGGVRASLEDWAQLGRQLVTADNRVKGRDLRLTLDAELQVEAFRLLDGRRGAVVMLDPASGALRVLASSPSFDPNRLGPDLFQAEDRDARLLNRATAGFYPPGSTFKVVIAAAALDRGLAGSMDAPAEGVTTSTRYPPIRDHDYYEAQRDGRPWRGHGRISLEQALVRSSNVYFAKLGLALGHQGFAQTVEHLGFNDELLLESTLSRPRRVARGRIPKIRDSDRYGLAQASIGQGRVLVTPLQMALITGAIANRGVSMQPRLVADVEPEALARFMSADTALSLSAMMRRAVIEGTGRGIDTPGLAIAGKTGTAQTGQTDSHSWFIGFAPVERPRLAVVVLVENAGYGSVVAAPIARDLLLLARDQGML